MDDLNKVSLIGEVIAPPQEDIARLDELAVRFVLVTQQSGNSRKNTEFHQIVAIGELGNRAKQDLKRGVRVFVEGRLKTVDWVDDEGDECLRCDVIVENLIFLGKKREKTSDKPNKRSTK